jgi:predicted secreted hydrolase
VSGQLWFDRQWGLDIRDPLQQWDWFSIRLADGRDIMLFRFPGNDGPVAFGTLVPAAGKPQHLSAADFEATPTGTWISPATGVEYCVTWKVAIPTEQLNLTVVAVANDQELDTRASTFNIYWEGLCDVEGLWQGKPVSGYAYVEQANGGF